MLENPAHPLFAVVWTEASDELHIKRGNPVSDQLGDLLLALSECDLQVLIPLERCGLAQQVTEWCHVVCLDKSVSYLVYETKPTAHITNVGWGREVPDGLHILVGRLDPP